MPVQQTSLTFTTTNQSLWGPGATPDFSISTGDLLFIPTQSTNFPIDVGLLGFGVAGEAYASFRAGLLAEATLGNAGSFDATFNINVSVDVPQAILLTNPVPAQMAFGFDNSRVVSATIDTSGFEGPSASLKLIIEASAGLRNMSYYTWWDEGNLGDVEFFDIDWEITLIQLDLSNVGFEIPLTDGLKLIGQLPAGADLEGQSYGQTFVEAEGQSDTAFLTLAADLDELLVKFASKIPGIGPVIKGIGETVFAEHVFDINDYVPFIPAKKIELKATLLDVGAELGAVLTESVKLDIGGGDSTPDVHVTLVSDNGTVGFTADDVSVSGVFGQGDLLLNAPTTLPGGATTGTINVTATYSLPTATFDHGVGVGLNFKITLQALQASLEGDWIPDALAFSFGPLLDLEFPDGGIEIDLFEVPLPQFNLAPNAFNQITQTYQVFATTVAPVGWNVNSSNAAQQIYEYAAALQANNNVANQTFGSLWAPRTLSTAAPSSTNQQSLTVNNAINSGVTGTPGAFNTTVFWDGSQTGSENIVTGTNGNFVVINLDPVVGGGPVRGLTTAQVLNSGGGVVQTLSEIAFAGTGKAALDALSTANGQIKYFMQTGPGGGSTVTFTTNGAVQINATSRNDILVSRGAGAEIYIGGSSTVPGGDIDLFVADFRAFGPQTAISWDLGEAVAAGTGVELSNGVFVKDVERFFIRTGDLDDVIKTHVYSDYVATAGGNDVVVNRADGAQTTLAGTDIISLGAGNDGLINEVSSFPPFNAAFGFEDLFYGGTGNDIALHDHSDATSGVRVALLVDNVYLPETGGNAGLGFDATIEQLTTLLVGHAQEVELSLTPQFDRDIEPSANVNDRDAVVLISGVGGPGNAVGQLRAVYFSDIEGVGVIGSEHNDLVLYDGGLFYSGDDTAPGATQSFSDTFVGAFLLYPEAIGAQNGVNYWLNIASPIPTIGTFGESQFLGFERLIIAGTNFADRLGGGYQSDLLSGENGDDVIYGGEFDVGDHLYGGDGNDLIIWDGSSGADTIRGDDSYFDTNDPSTFVDTLAVSATTIRLGSDGASEGLTYAFRAGLLGTGAQVGSQAKYVATDSIAALLEALTLVSGSDASAGTVNEYAKMMTFNGSNSATNYMRYAEFEKVNIQGSDFGELLIYEGGASYIGGGNFLTGYDTFVADFSNQRVAISLDLTFPDQAGPAGVVLQNGVRIAEIERIILFAGKGSDVLVGGAFDDFIHGGDGADSILGGGGNDSLVGGADNDIFAVSNGADTVDGGTGNDNIIFGSSLVDRTFEIRDSGGTTLTTLGVGGVVDSTSSLAALVQAADVSLDATHTWIISNAGNIVNLRNVENISMAGRDSASDLMIYRGGALYMAGENTTPGADIDVFVANLSTATENLTFDASDAAAQAAEQDFGLGTFIQGFERFVLRLGSGDDRVEGNLVHQDFVDGGAGNDSLTGGTDATTAADSMLGGAGNDVVTYTGGNLVADGGTGTDLLNVDVGGTAISTKIFNSGGTLIAHHLGSTPGINRAYLSNVYTNQIPNIATTEILTRTGTDTTSVTATLFEEFNIVGTAAADFVFAGTGDSVLRTNGGNDVLMSRGGNDLLIGGTGVDSYVFDGAAGADVIFGEGTGGNGAILYFLNHTLAQLTFSAIGEDLRIDMTGGSVTVKSYFAAGGNGLNFTFDTIGFRGTQNLSGLFTGVPSGTPVNGPTLNGTAGNDTLTANQNGANTVNGGAGDDYIVGDFGGDLIDGGTGDDILTFAHLSTGVSVDLLFRNGNGGAAAGDVYISIEHIVGGQGSNGLFGSQRDNLIVGGNSADVMSGRDGNDYFVGAGGNDTIDGEKDDDTLAGDAGRDSLSGSEGNDSLHGGTEQDTLSGGDGNDLLRGALGNDSARGDDGDDIYIFGGQEDPATSARDDGNDTFDGGVGTDMADFSLFEGAVLVELADLVTTVESRFGATLDPSVGALVAIMRLANVEDVAGSDFDDVIVGNGAANYLYGGIGDDVITGNVGVDTLDGGSGFDTADYSKETGGFGIRVDLDGVLTGTPNTVWDTNPTDFIDVVIDIERFIGSANADEFSLGGGDEFAFGGAGADTFDGREGNDFLEGGEGADVFSDSGTVDSNGDMIAYTGSDAGVAVSFANGTFSGGHAAGDSLGTGVIENLMGSTFDDTLTGSTGSNVVFGGAGNDIVDGWEGRDSVNGGSGNDIVYGWIGDDIVSGGSGDDQVFGESGNDTLAYGGSDIASTPANEDGFDFLDGGADIDTVDFTLFRAAVLVDLSLAVNQASTAFATNAEPGAGPFTNLASFASIENITGSTFDDRLIGDAGANSIAGGEGHDHLVGGAGADSFSGGAGIDTLDYSTSGLLAIRVEVDGPLGSARGYRIFENLAGTPDRAFDIDRIIGTGGTDIFQMSNFADSMYGAGGSDSLEGRQGNDYYEGGAGGDTLLEGGTDAMDVLGYSTSDAGVSVNLATGAVSGGHATGDVLSFPLAFEGAVGSAHNDTLTGSDLANYLSGNAGNDTINGGLGNDTVDGGLGNDTMEGGGGLDWLSLMSATGATTINLARTTLQNTTAQGLDLITGFENILGSAFNDTFSGSAGDNILEGGAGDDSMSGNFGNDSHYGGAGNDRFQGSAGNDLFDGGEGIDIVFFSTASSVVIYLDSSGPNAAAAAGDSFVGIENVAGAIGSDFIFGNGDANRLSGATGNDNLFGSGGADQLEGDNGNDRLSGGFGNDVLVGGTGSDIFVFSEGPIAGGIDRTNDFIVADDQIEIDASEFGGGLVAGQTVQLVSGAAPSVAGFSGPVFLYNTTNGFLSFDADGQGLAFTAITFFRLQNLPTLTAADFTVVA